MEKKKLLSIGGRLIFEAAVETTLSLVLAALAGGADLRGANLGGANLPSPTMVLMANWFEVSVDLCRDLMNYDAACRPYDLMKRLIEEKCPAWTDEQTKEFEERFKK